MTGADRPRGSNERGLLATELAILMPVILLIAVVAVFVLQVERHSSRAQQAADAAARAASLSRGETQALAAAQAAASAVCLGTASIDSADWKFNPPDLDSFTPGWVRVGVTCTESYSGFKPLVPDQPRGESAQAISVIEYWRDNS